MLLMGGISLCRGINNGLVGRVMSFYGYLVSFIWGY